MGTSIHDQSVTAASNVSIAGVSAAEGMSPSGVNDVIRGLAAQTKGAVTSVTATGTDTYTATLAPAADALTSGMTIQVTFTNANTSTTPTLAINGLTAKTIVKNGSAALAAGDIPAGHEATLRYNGTNWVLLNPKGTAVTAGAGLTGTTSFAANLVVNAQTGTSYTILSSDLAKLVTLTNASSIAVTIPDATGSFAAGFFFDLENLAAAAGVATVTRTSTSTIDGSTSIILQPGACIRFVSDGTNWQVVRGQVPASRANMQAATNLQNTVSPKRMEDHPGVAKASGSFTTTGATSEATASASCTKNSTGNYTMTLGVTMANTSYRAIVTATRAAGSGAITKVVSKTTTTVTYETMDATATVQDLAHDVVIFGTLA